MATLQQVNTLREQLEDVNVLAQRDIDAIFRQIVAGFDLSTDEARGVLAQVMPGVLTPYAATIGSMTQDFYYTDRSAVGVQSFYRGTPAPVLPAVGQIESLVSYATRQLVANPVAIAAAGALLVGGAQRLLFNAERDTLFSLGQDDPEPVRYQRMTTSAEPCEFCIMLASRGAVYESEGSAGVVTGRGVPIPDTPRAGGQAKGIRPRGPKLIGERFHDNDKCVAVAVHRGRRQEMEREAVGHFELYAEARARMEPRNLKWTEYKLPDGSLKRKYRWEDDAQHIVDSRQQTKKLLALMRQIRRESSLSRI